MSRKRIEPGGVFQTDGIAPMMSVHGLVKRFLGAEGIVEALAGVDFAIDNRAKIVALIGPDGAGKSTLMQLACGLEAPDEGEIRVLGRKPDPDDESFAAAVAYMPQSLGLYRDLTVSENLALFESLRRVRSVPGKNIEQAQQGTFSEEALLARRLGLIATAGLKGFENRLCGALSGGMKQKLALACSLAGNPELLLLDEPTVGVDPLSRRELWAVIRRMVDERGMRCFFSTAYLEEAQAVDAVLLLENGRLVLAGTPNDFLAHASARTYSIGIRETNARGSASAVWRPSPAAARERLDDVTAADAKLLDIVPHDGGIDVLTLRDASAEVPSGYTLLAREPKLEDAYAALTLEDDAAKLRNASAANSNRQDREATSKGKRVIIRAKNISRRFGHFVAVADTTFEVREGEIFGLLGPNGAGKTTTFRMLCGLLQPSSGSIEIDGLELAEALSRVRGEIGYVAQKFSLYGKLSVEENLRYFAGSYGFRGCAKDEAVERALNENGLTHLKRTMARALSAGAKRDLSIAAALMHSPKILFLDEATSGADLASRRALWRRLAKLAARGTAVVVTTHFLEEAEYCDRFLIQDAGRILAIGTPDEVRAAARQALTGAGASEAAQTAVRSIEDAFIAIVEEDRRKRGVAQTQKRTNVTESGEGAR